MFNKLSEGEQIIKSWEYAVEKEGKDETHAYLTITNKRVISSVENSHKYAFSEILLQYIRKIDASRDTQSSKGLLALLAALLMAGGIILTFILIVNNLYQSYLVYPLIMIVAGIVLFIIAILSKKKGLFYLSFSVAESGSGAVAIYANTMKHKKESMNTIYIQVDFKLIDEMLSSIGAIILENTVA